jgi:hypothetical protein
MVNNEAGLTSNMKSDQERKSFQGEPKQSGQWTQVIGQVMEKVVSGTNMMTTIAFDNLEIDVPRAQGPDGRDLGGATWKINGKLVWLCTNVQERGGFTIISYPCLDISLSVAVFRDIFGSSTIG